jgi:hypothetical protein
MHRWIVLVACALGMSATSALGRDIFLTVGGGPDPTSNQVSLEKNVQYFQRMLARRMPAGVEHTILFADGDDPGRDTQLVDPSQPVPAVNQLLAEIYGQTSGLDERYRSHEVPEVQAPATPSELTRWFDEVAPKLQEGDRLFIYCTGHGGKNAKDLWNSHLWMWRRQQLSVQAMAKELDKVPAGVPVTLVMVQCYGGSFANLVFREGQSDEGVCDAPRCGFFATTHDRPAAGCTPDVDEADYEDYSSHFFAGLFGMSRTGESVTAPDFNGDGHISLEEAHAHAVVFGDSIDIPTTTIEAFLRKYSSTETETDGAVKADMPNDQLFDLASTTEQAMLTGLARRLGLEEANVYLSAKQQSEYAERKRKDIEKQRRPLTNQRNEAAKPIRSAIEALYPELKNPWHPDHARLLEERASEIEQLIQNHPSFEKFDNCRKELAKLSQEIRSLTNREAACARVLRIAENVALGANLPLVADETIQQRYQELHQLEAAQVLAVDDGSVKLAP